mmetsp:Transcript_42068/g.116180  ORF Transcript_42068/g.116180 Transcript_42068/m.116180 type:complete len:435 (-) Transcript_42068:112-1416(-)
MEGARRTGGDGSTLFETATMAAIAAVVRDMDVASDTATSPTSGLASPSTSEPAGPAVEAVAVPSGTSWLRRRAPPMLLSTGSGNSLDCGEEERDICSPGLCICKQPEMEEQSVTATPELMRVMSVSETDVSDGISPKASSGRMQRRRPQCMTDCASPSPPPKGMHRCGGGDSASEDLSPEGQMCFSYFDRRPRSLNLTTPSSRSSFSYEILLTPGTPDPQRNDLKLISGDVGAIMFDFDGTLTASPGDTAQRSRKQVELRERAPILAPRLRILREAGILLGIISKSSELTIRNALEEAELTHFFDGPVLAKAVGLEGKAGFIDELARKGSLGRKNNDDLTRVMLVDDDVRELDRARARGIQTYAAPSNGGLQEEDFDEIFEGLGLKPRTPLRRSPRRPTRSATTPSASVGAHASAPTLPTPLLPPPPPTPSARR